MESLFGFRYSEICVSCVVLSQVLVSTRGRSVLLIVSLKLMGWLTFDLCRDSSCIGICDSMGCLIFLVSRTILHSWEGKIDLKARPKISQMVAWYFHRSQILPFLLRPIKRATRWGTLTRIFEPFEYLPARLNENLTFFLIFFFCFLEKLN